MDENKLPAASKPPPSGAESSSAGPADTQSIQALIAQLQAAIDADPANTAAIKEGLSRLQGLLAAPVRPAEPATTDEAAALRAELDRVIQETASFASLMVHEIRKPMTTIRGYIDMLAKPGMVGTLNEMQQQFINTVRTNVLRMEGLVADISDISKLNSGRLRLDPKMTTFGQIMMDVQKQVEPLAAEYSQTVTYELPQGLPILNADARQLAKVIYYLLRNAIQYTPKSTGKITLRAERLDGNVLSVTITDNGIGMTPEEVARLGELFYRADHELVTSERGYGLGLPIVMGFIKLMGGTFLPVKSEPEKGSTFGFTLTGIG
jgi:signal transduction histidine kinase